MASVTGRMVVVAKHNGSQSCPCQSPPTVSTWQLVSTIPENVYKSIFDYWHGYHSMSIAEEERHLATFVTPYGAYKTCPQGIQLAVDMYTNRMDRLFEDYDRLVWL